MECEDNYSDDLFNSDNEVYTNCKAYPSVPPL
jgi:hypothetical protein